MTSINDVADLPKLLEAWASGKGYREAFGIDAERALVEDLRKLLSLTVQQAKALEDSRERAYALEQRLPASQIDDQEPEFRAESEIPPADPLEEAARLDRKAGGTLSSPAPLSSRRSWLPTVAGSRSRS